MFAIALAVAAVPEALAAIVTGALAIGMQQMAKRNALIRKMPAVETLGCVTVICSDKTGTLTKGEMTVRKIFAGGKMVELTGAGYDPVGEFRGAGEGKIEVSEPIRKLLLGGLLCNDSVLEKVDGKWIIKGDPTEGALVVAAVKAGFHETELRLENSRVEEIPFQLREEEDDHDPSNVRWKTGSLHERRSGSCPAELYSYFNGRWHSGAK